jgi:hypothetical protein
MIPARRPDRERGAAAEWTINAYVLARPRSSNITEELISLALP